MYIVYNRHEANTIFITKEVAVFSMFKQRCAMYYSIYVGRHIKSIPLILSFQCIKLKLCDVMLSVYTT